MSRAEAGRPAQVSGAALEITDVSHTFATKRARVAVFEDFNCSVQAGEFIAILGPSGCGKSTLLRIIAGLIRPTRGQVVLDGTPVTRPGREVGMVFQDDALLEWRTAFENVMLPAEIKGISKSAVAERAHELLGQVGLTDFQDSRPSQLSGGMKQRVAICQALVYQPRLLLMDEPFGALDALTRKQMQLDLQGLWRNQCNTVLFVTHSIEEAVLLADRVLVMSPRPARLVKEYRIDLERPRNSETERDATYRDAVTDIEGLFGSLGVLRQEAVVTPLGGKLISDNGSGAS
ncbi:MAG: ABC transporter ATP-binding protein [Candidatus Dormibacteria bacterium]